MAAWPDPAYAWHAAVHLPDGHCAPQQPPLQSLDQHWVPMATMGLQGLAVLQQGFGGWVSGWVGGWVGWRAGV